jgi:hypothetical protein
MTRTRFLLIAGSVAGCIVTLGVLALLPTKPGVTKANFDRIGIGMAYWDEIELLLGEPGDFTTGPYAFSDTVFIEPKAATDDFNRVLHLPVYGRRVWIADEGIIIIFFDNKDNVISKGFRWVESTNPSLWQQLRRIIGS